ncbi:MAG TPA: helix-turn-helix domain-containing protein [Dehalococcoidia bacterium]|nr:helix-turn-helix domain-containing protein [Dehalococcoidia bacterium]
MYIYAKYCPVAATTNVIGDFWTPLIVRELLYGTGHFNQLVRNVPGISRALLAKRLRTLERAGLVTCERNASRNSTRYQLTPAGHDLKPVIEAMDAWGSRWGKPDDKGDLDPLTTICMLKSRIVTEALPAEKIVIEVLATGNGQARAWLVCERPGVSMCFDPPGFETDLWVSGEAAGFYALWLQGTTIGELLASGKVCVEGRPDLVAAFARWFEAKETAAVPA